MDKIIINDLEVYAFHGLFKEENILGQKFLISLILHSDFLQASKNDNTAKLLDYAEVCKFTEDSFKKNQFKLIETCAEYVASEILKNFETVNMVEVTVKKPWAPIGCHLDYVAVNITRGRHTVYLALGSNMGDKAEYLNTAINALNTDDTKVVKVSKFYETEPVGYLDQEKFLNCAVAIKTLLSPLELFDLTSNIERSLGRVRTIPNGPRTIDVDILLYDEDIFHTDCLIIPHERMTERCFVLEPLAEIAPYAMHPIEQKPVIRLLNNLKEKDQ